MSRCTVSTHTHAHIHAQKIREGKKDDRQRERKRTLRFVRDTQSFMWFILLECLGCIIVHW